MTSYTIFLDLMLIAFSIIMKFCGGYATVTVLSETLRHHRLDTAGCQLAFPSNPIS